MARLSSVLLVQIFAWGFVPQPERYNYCIISCALRLATTHHVRTETFPIAPHQNQSTSHLLVIPLPPRHHYHG